MSKGKSAAFGLVCLGLAVTAQAQGGGGGREQPRIVLQALDTDHDGTLSAAELAGATASLKTLDRNGDGQLTQDELQGKPPSAGSGDDLVRQLMVFDRNGDGVLTADELPARMQPMFLRGDANHDGKLTPDEIRAMAAHQSMPVGTAVGAGHAEGTMRNDPLLNALDTDHDGILSAAELAEATASLKTLDTDGDGQITPNEMQVHQMTPAERVDHLLGEWDTDHDGRISKAEAPDRLQAQFASIDTDEDGYLDRAELVRYFSTQGSGGRGQGAGQGAGQGGAKVPNGGGL